MVGIEKSRSFIVHGKIDTTPKTAYQYRSTDTKLITNYEVDGSPIMVDMFHTLYDAAEKIVYYSDVTPTQVDEIVSTKPMSSYCPSFNLIPYGALVSLARRFELGAKKYAKDNWRRGLTDKDYVIERINHGINHALTLIEKLEGRIPWDNDDDAGGMLWAGAFASEAVRTLHPEVVGGFE